MPETQLASETIRRAKDELWTRGWSQSGPESQGTVCIMVALGLGLGHSFDELVNDEVGWSNLVAPCDAARAVAEALDDLYPRTSAFCGAPVSWKGQDLWIWNDQEEADDSFPADRSFNDIIDVLDLAEKKALAREELVLAGGA